jgi:CheY-like chemotaxis protein
MADTDSSEANDVSRQVTILVVEDEILVRSTTSESLRDLGFTVIEAADADEAMAVFAGRQSIDVVFTDWRMPGSMNGLELARWVSEHHPTVKILLTSGNNEFTNATTYLAKDAFLRKPYSLEAVAERIRTLTGSSR